MSNTRGWSLLEVLIVITVSAVAGVLLINFLVSSGRLFIDQSARINHSLSLNDSQREMTELIKSSAGIVLQYPVSGTPQYTTDSSTLIVKLPAVSSNGEVLDSIYDYAVVKADSNNPQILRKQVFKDALSYRNTENKVLSTNLKSLNFSYLDINNAPVSPLLAVRVGFTINLSTKSGLSERESTSSGVANLKNL